MRKRRREIQLEHLKHNLTLGRMITRRLPTMTLTRMLLLVMVKLRVMVMQHLRANLQETLTRLTVERTPQKMIY